MVFIMANVIEGVKTVNANKFEQCACDSLANAMLLAEPLTATPARSRTPNLGHFGISERKKIKVVEPKKMEKPTPAKRQSSLTNFKFSGSDSLYSFTRAQSSCRIH
jgi:hypothetical protein